MDRIFPPSRHITFKYLLLGLPAIFLIGLFLYTFATYQPEKTSDTTNIILFSVLAFLVFMQWQIYRLYKNLSYTLTDDTFKYNFGISSGEIKIASIKSISTGSYPAAGNRPALDFKGLKIIYGEGYTIFVAPENQTSFILALQKINPQIKVFT